MRIADTNPHGNKNWERKNNCTGCAHRTPFTTDHCKMVGDKPKQKCPFFEVKQ